MKKYANYPNQFEIWCGIDYTGYDSDENWTTHAISELGDKGEGLFYERDMFGYHWPLNGIGLPGEILESVYNKNASILYSTL